MQIANNTVFASTASGFGGWNNVGHMSGWSLHVMGLETGGVLVIRGSNESFIPTNAVMDANAATLQTVTSTGVPVLVQGVGLAHWIQIQKTAGGGPTATVVNLYG